MTGARVSVTDVDCQEPLGTADQRFERDHRQRFSDVVHRWAADRRGVSAAWVRVVP